MKAIQRKLSKLLWNYQLSIWDDIGHIPNISHAFEKQKSIITNAKVHRNKRYILNLDLQDFFDSFHFGRVRGYFQKNRFFQLPEEVATTIAQLTCYKGHLPQGAPSSPIITNLICKILDIHLLKIAKKYKLDYTRYADDLTFSTNNKNFKNIWLRFMSEISNEIKKAGFTINERKVRLQFKDSRQVVTGLIVNKKLNVDRRYYKLVRAMADRLYKDGEYRIDGEKGTLNQLEGRFAFINQLDFYNNLLDDENHTFGNLNAREKQYQKFLFYKYFYGNKNPLIVTEGKTDKLYIKSALRKLYTEYPTLITKKSDGTFEYKISFLKRSARLKYFLGIYPDGASVLKKIYFYFINKNKSYPNLFDQIKSNGNQPPKNPVFFIFDNELNNPKKPLADFANCSNMSPSNKVKLQNELKFKLKDNLYLLTNPLINEAEESEIEDLFDIETLSLKINGKTFNRDKNIDINKYYGKEIFAKYISDHYIEINFDKFKPLLDNLKQLTSLYA